MSALVIIATHMIMDTCEWTLSGENHKAVIATAIPRAFATIGRPARSMALST